MLVADPSSTENHVGIATYHNQPVVQLNGRANRDFATIFDFTNIALGTYLRTFYNGVSELGSGFTSNITGNCLLHSVSISPQRTILARVRHVFLKLLQLIPSNYPDYEQVAREFLRANESE